MNSDFNLQDLVYYKGQPGKIVGLLEGGDKVMVLVGDNNVTIPYNHTELLTLKQKKHRDAIKENNERINKIAIEQAAKAAAEKAAAEKAAAEIPQPPVGATPVINNVDSKPE